MTQRRIITKIRNSNNLPIILWIFIKLGEPRTCGEFVVYCTSTIDSVKSAFPGTIVLFFSTIYSEGPEFSQ